MPTLVQSTANLSTIDRPNDKAMSEVTPAEKALAFPGVSNRPR